MTRSPLASCLVLALASVSCGGPPTEPDPGRTSEAITSGVADDADTAAVLIVAKVGGGTGFCSGVIVSPHVVLTAAHCSAPRADYAIFIGADYNDAAARAAQGNLVAVTEHHAHPNYDSSTNENDIGVLITTDPIARAPAAINRRGLAKSDIGKPIRIVGYGQTSGDSKAMGRRTQGTTTIADFDPTTLTVRNVPNICLNDSGGPTFMTREGEEVVVGIHFIIDSAKCDGEGLDMRVDGYTDFVDGYIQSNDPPRSGDGSAEDDAGAPREASPSAAETTPPAAPASGCVLGRARTASGDALLVALIATALLVVRKRSAHRGRTRISSGAAGTPGPA